MLKRAKRWGGDIYQVSLIRQAKDLLEHHLNKQLSKNLPATPPLTDLFIHLIKDSMVLKAGIRVYLRHLIPYFSRISHFSHEDYARLEIYFLHDIENHVKENEAALEKLHHLGFHSSSIWYFCLYQCD